MSKPSYHLFRGCSALLLCLCLFTGTSAQEHYDPIVVRQQLAHSRSDTARVMQLLHLGNYYLVKPGELKSDLDSATLLQQQGMALARYLRFKEGIAGSTFLEARILWEKGQPAPARARMDEALQLAVTGHFRQIEGSIYREQAYWLGNDGENFDRKLLTMEKARSIFHEVHDGMQEGNMLKGIAEIYQFKGRFDTAAVLLDRALALYRSIGTKDLAGIYVLMEETHRAANDFPQALHFGLLAIRTVEDLHDESQQRVEVYNRVAILYSIMRDFDQALVYLEKARAAALALRDSVSIAIISCNIADMYKGKGKLAEASAIMKRTARDYMPKNLFAGQASVAITCVNIFVANNEIKAAKPYYEMLVKFYKQMDSQHDEQIGLLFSMILYQQALGHYAATYPLLDTYLAYHRQRNTAAQLYLGELAYFRADSAQGHLLSAIKHYQLAKQYSDARTSIAQSRLVATMRAQFDLESKDKDIQLLSKQNQLQTNSLRQEQLLRNLVLAGIVMLLLLLALIYSRYRTKQRSHLQLQQKQHEINQQNELLKKLLTDKEWLVREIHHRVKNNLQIVISLLNSQSAYLNNEDAIHAIRNSQHRMHAMSLIHQKLYQSDNLATIDMQWYLQELVNYMRDSFDTNQQIRFILQTEPLMLDVAQAVPLGLILNEAISNAIKYAFPDKRKGEINIVLQSKDDTHLQLSICDNGVGLPDNFNPLESQSLGMSLMRGLAEQLDGDIQIKNIIGLSIYITFMKREDPAHLEQQTRA